MKLNEEIVRLRAEGSSPEAKGRLIARLQHKKEHNTMKLIGRITIPVALAASLAVGGMLIMPRTALATPATVAKAIRKVQNYVINSFMVQDGKRTLMSKTTFADGKTARSFFDSKGNPVPEGADSPLEGALFEMAIRNGDGKELVLRHGEAGSENQKLDVRVTKGKDGKAEKHFFVNGKEVKELPQGAQGHVVIDGEPIQGSLGQQFVTSEDTVTTKSGTDGVVRRSGAAMVTRDDKGIVSKFTSGQTSVDYLLKLLDDPSRWTVEHGVLWAGQKLDKFMLKGSMSPIELYVDPLTSLPKVLRFVGGGRDSMAPQIEDEYVYGAVPPTQK